MGSLPIYITQTNILRHILDNHQHVIYPTTAITSNHTKGSHYNIHNPQPSTSSHKLIHTFEEFETINPTHEELSQWNTSYLANLITLFKKSPNNNYKS
jgi:hypothetical protein